MGRKSRMRQGEDRRMPRVVDCGSLLSRARRWLRQRYLRKKYGGRPPKLYYDPRYRTYISPVKLEEDGDISWVCGELAGDCLIYKYRLGDVDTHGHEFEWVLRDAYDHAEEFSIPEEYRDQYSAQELNFLEKVAERGRRDRRE